MRSMRLGRYIWLLCATMVIACNKTEDMAQNLSCEISIVGKQQCSEHPTLQHGQLEFGDDGQFEFTGDYDACFDKRRIQAVGRYKIDKYPNGIKMELLANWFYGADSKMENFPRTIGSVDLERKTLKGVYTDLWAIMANRGIPTKESGQRHMVECRR